MLYNLAHGLDSIVCVWNSDFIMIIIISLLFVTQWEKCAALLPRSAIPVSICMCVCVYMYKYLVVCGTATTQPEKRED